MNFGLSESQRILRDSARKFFSVECPIPEVRRIMETPDAFDGQLYKKLAEQGFTGIILPEEHGGLGLGIVEMAVLLEEMGRAMLPGPYFSSAILAGSVLHEAHGFHHLAATADGTKRATLALVEEQGSWNPDSLQMTGLNGTKLFVTDAGVADTVVVATQSALYAVDSRAKGVTIQPMPGMDPTRPLYSVHFDHAEGELLGEGPQARKALQKALNIAEVALAAELTGGMQRAMEITVEYAKTRKQFGKPIGGYQAVQHQCADMYFFTEGSRSSALYAAWALDNKAPDAEKAVAIAKMYSSDSGREVGNRAIQVHGGMGFTWENDCHLYYRRAKASEVMLGDAAYHRERIASMIIDTVEVSSGTLEEAFALD